MKAWAVVTFISCALTFMLGYFVRYVTERSHDERAQQRITEVQQRANVLGEISKQIRLLAERDVIQERAVERIEKDHMDLLKMADDIENTIDDQKLARIRMEQNMIRIEELLKR